MKRKFEHKQSFQLFLVLCLVISTGLLSAFPAAAPSSATTIHVAGMNAEPSIRPRSYLGPNPDGWFDPSHGITYVDSEVALVKDLAVRIMRIEFPWFLLEL
jgi:hypothetical protein